MNIASGYSFDSLHSDNGSRVIFRGIVGSRAYGTNRPESDEDVRGVFLVPPIEYALLSTPPEQVADEMNDRVYYSLRRFAELAAASNPNLLELFWLPSDCILLDTPQFSLLRENRRLFLSRRAVDTHIGYALAQIKKARGCNKRVWNPQPVEPPRPEDFCRIVLGSDGEPRSPAEVGIDFAACRITRIDGAERAFALHSGGDPAAGGPIRGCKPYCTPGLRQDAPTRIGMLFFNESAFAQAKRAHSQYWEWRRTRNDARWVSQESGQLDYDAKNMMHLIRLLQSGLNIVRHGAPIVRFEGAERDRLLAIRDGKWTFDEIMSFSDSLQADIRSEIDTSPLPPEPDIAAIDALLQELQPAPLPNVLAGTGPCGETNRNSDASDGSSNASPRIAPSVSEGVGTSGVEKVPGILDALRTQEKKHGLRMLYAAESGSRAWGFASPDSDWDVRAIYVHPLDWYLRIDEKPADTIGAMLPGDIDISAWELRKALRLFAKSNVPLLEWLGSPIVYLAKDGVAGRLRELIPAFFNPRGAAWHHLSMQRSALGDVTADGSIRIKKLCYALRSALSVRWIAAKASMPPVPFLELFAASDLDSATREAFDAVLASKSTASESVRIPLPPLLATLFAENEHLVPAAIFPEKERPDNRKLDELFRWEVSKR